MLIDRRRWLQIGAAGAGLAAAPAQARQDGAERPSAVVRILSKGRTGGTAYEGVLQALKSYVEAHLEGYGLPGMTVCVADDEGFAAAIDAGWANVDKRVPVGPNHLFQIGSISKSMAAIGVLKAASEGLLGLDDPLDRHLGDAPLPPDPITIRQLLTHASGLPDDAPVFPRGAPRLWTGYTPGERFSYSNTGYGLLGLILQKVRRKPYAAVVREDVLTPLGMAAARGVIRAGDQPFYAEGYWPLDQDKPFPQHGPLGVAAFTDFSEASGCIAATAQDMSAYVRFLIHAGSGRGGPLISDRDAALFTAPVIEAKEFGPKARYALGLAVVPIEGRSCLHHTGGMLAFSSSIHVDPKAKVGAFASANARIGGYRPRDVTAYALMLMRAAGEGRPPPPPPGLKDDARVERASDYDGTYQSASGESFALQGRGERLILIHEGRSTPVRTFGEDLFLAPVPRFEAVLLAVRREGGRPTEIWWGDQVFSKDRAPSAAGPVDPALAAKAGFYVNNDPWAGSFWIFARPDGLWIDGVEPLAPLGDGSYRIGKDPFGCERIGFDAALGGRFQRAILSGRDHWRFDAGD